MMTRPEPEFYPYKAFLRTVAGQSFRRWKDVWGRWRLQPLVARSVPRDVTAAVTTMSRGEALVVHVLLPHYPYVFDGACALRPPGSWLVRITYHGSDDATTRAVRYRAYFEQVQCTERLIGGVMQSVDANPARRDATVLIHGDHASKIALETGKTRSPGYSEDDEWRDWHPTLFAVRRPGIEPGVNDGRSTIVLLFRRSFRPGSASGTQAGPVLEANSRGAVSGAR